MFSLLDLLCWKPPAGIVDGGALRRVWIEHYHAVGGEPFTSRNICCPMYQVLSSAWEDGLALHTAPAAQRLCADRGNDDAQRHQHRAHSRREHDALSRGAGTPTATGIAIML